MKTLLICHEGALLDQEGLARWLRSFSELTGLLVLRENRSRMKKRISRELQRVGWLRFLDVLAFRLYYKLALAAQDRAWEAGKLDELRADYPGDLSAIPTLITHSPNSREAEQFIRDQAPDVMIARCKSLLAERIFSIPRTGTFVMHPGMCPEYRNAHGCFWALANHEPEKVAMTLLKIDRGIDTGPVFGWFGCEFSEQTATHIQIQHQTVLDNLDEIRELLEAIHRGEARSLDITGRKSAEWGQPWLTRYLRWKRHARRGSHANSLTPVS